MRLFLLSTLNIKGRFFITCTLLNHILHMSSHSLLYDPSTRNISPLISNPREVLIRKSISIYNIRTFEWKFYCFKLQTAIHIVIRLWTFWLLPKSPHNPFSDLYINLTLPPVTWSKPYQQDDDFSLFPRLTKQNPGEVNAYPIVQEKETETPRSYSGHIVREIKI